MGLTREQRAERERMKRDAENRKAWDYLVALDPLDAPVPLPKPKGSEPISGWAFNTGSAYSSGHVELRWQTGSGEYSSNPRNSKHPCGSRNRSDLYATEAEARLAMMYAYRDEVSEKAARMLRNGSAK